MTKMPKKFYPTRTQLSLEQKMIHCGWGFRATLQGSVFVGWGLQYGDSFLGGWSLQELLD